MGAFETFLVSLSITILGFLLKYFFSRKPRLRYYYGAITDISFSVPPANASNSSETSEASTVNTPIASEVPMSGNSQIEASEVAISANQTPTFNFIRTHTVIISNQGNASARNVRIGHYFLPAHSVSPPLNVQNQENTNEILVPILCPKEFFTISYLYPRPILWSNINAYFKCDEGMAEFANMQDIRIKSPFLIGLINVVFFVGILSIIYFTIKIAPILYKLYFLANS
jgi:hypothetical protein